MASFSTRILLATDGSQEIELTAGVAVELAKSPGGAIAKSIESRARALGSLLTRFGPLIRLVPYVEAEKKNFRRRHEAEHGWEHE